MIDPLLSLAFSVHANKGVYALLLGSGVSRTARIPTGWEVVKELIRKLAHMQGANCGEDPAGWYRSQYAEDANYSKLLDQIGKSPSDRSQLLRGYFEPTPEERDQGIKRPTQAHKAIARLMVDGYIRVVVTTNFDRLLEQALEELGAQPTVISTPEAVDGARPLIHSGPTIVKIHGDYRDERVKNTLAELETYDARLDNLLDRIWAEFGIVTCGWSADWDVGLSKSLERCPNHRFSMYWTTLDAPSEKAQRLIEQRRATVMKINGADAFFAELAEKVSALESFDRPHPLSARVAVETLKNYLVEERHRIRLDDLVRDECERVVSEMSSSQFTTSARAFSEPEYKALVGKYEAVSEVLVSMIAAGCYWGEEAHLSLWTRCLERLGSPKVEGEPDLWDELRLYPALLAFYAGGMSALAGSRWRTFIALATKTRLKIAGKDRSAARGISSGCLNYEAAQHLPRLKPLRKDEKYLYPVSEHLYVTLREPLRRLVPDDEAYDVLFDRFEYLIAFAWVEGSDPKAQLLFPFGRYMRKIRTESEKSVQNIIGMELAEQGQNWALFREGFVSPDWQRFLELKKAFDAQVRVFASQR